MKQLAKEVAEGISNVTTYLDEFKEDEKVKELNKKRLVPLSEFIDKLEETDPYAPLLLYENNYVIQSKGMRMHPEAFVSPSQKLSIMKNIPLVSSVYPELKEHLRNKDCKGCKSNSYSTTMLNCISILGGIDRDVEPLRPFLGDKYVDLLKELKPNTEFTIDMLLGVKPLPQITRNPKPIIKPTKVVMNQNFLVHQCFNCTKEHIAKAIGLLLEYYKDKTLYSSHYWRAIGNLGLAEVECIQINPELSTGIRAEKSKLIEDMDYIPNLEQFFDY